MKAASYRHAAHPPVTRRRLGDTYEGWDGASALSTRRRKGDICEVTMRHGGITDQLVGHRLTQPLRVSLCVFPSLSVRFTKSVFRDHSLSLRQPGFSVSAEDAPSPPSTPPSILFFSLPLPLTSLEFLRCASSCVAPSDPTARNTCNQRERNREQLVSVLPMRGEGVCFVD